MKTTGPLMIGVLVVGIAAIIGSTTPVDSWALDAVHLDARFGPKVHRGTADSAITLADPWSEHRVQQYLKQARDHFQVVESQPKSTVLAGEAGDFLGSARQGKKVSGPGTFQKTERLSCQACSTIERGLKEPPQLICRNTCVAECGY